MDDQSNQSEVIPGVDTHLDMHVAAVISNTGKLLGTLATPTNESGYLKLLSWARSLGCVRRVGVEGTATYGAGLARVLREQGSKSWKSTVLTVPSDGYRESQTPLMQKMLRDPYYQALLPPFQKRSLELLKQCAPFPLQDAVRSRPKHRPLTN